MLNLKDKIPKGSTRDVDPTATINFAGTCQGGQIPQKREMFPSDVSGKYCPMYEICDWITYFIC